MFVIVVAPRLSQVSEYIKLLILKLWFFFFFFSSPFLWVFFKSKNERECMPTSRQLRFQQGLKINASGCIPETVSKKSEITDTGFLEGFCVARSDAISSVADQTDWGIKDSKCFAAGAKNEKK